MWNKYESRSTTHIVFISGFLPLRLPHISQGLLLYWCLKPVPPLFSLSSNTFDWQALIQSCEDVRCKRQVWGQRKSLTRDYLPGDNVVVQSPTSKLWDSTGKIISSTNSGVSYKVQLGDDSGQVIRHRHHLRIHRRKRALAQDAILNPGPTPTVTPQVCFTPRVAPDPDPPYDGPATQTRSSVKLLTQDPPNYISVMIKLLTSIVLSWSTLPSI